MSSCHDFPWLPVLFNHCPFLLPQGEDVQKVLDEWKEYKMGVPTYGAIIIDESLENVSGILSWRILLCLVLLLCQSTERRLLQWLLNALLDKCLVHSCIMYLVFYWDSSPQFREASWYTGIFRIIFKLVFQYLTLMSINIKCKQCWWCFWSIDSWFPFVDSGGWPCWSEATDWRLSPVVSKSDC